MRGFNTGTLMFSLFSHINQSTSSAHDWVMNSQSEFDWLAYTDQRKNNNSNVDKRTIDKQNDSKWCDTSEKRQFTKANFWNTISQSRFLNITEPEYLHASDIFRDFLLCQVEKTPDWEQKPCKELVSFVIHSIHTTIKALWGTYCVWNLS